METLNCFSWGLNVSLAVTCLVGVTLVISQSLFSFIKIFTNSMRIFTNVIISSCFTFWCRGDPSRHSLREKCLYSEFFLVRIFPHSDWIWRDTEYLTVFSPNEGKYGPERFEYRHVTQWFVCSKQQWWYQSKKGISVQS